MVKSEYANAYKEVLVIINNLIKEDYDKIPKEYIEFLSANCNMDYEFKYDNSKAFEEQNLLEDTKYILFGLFEDFGATKEQKDKIKAFKNDYYSKLEEEKKEKYNPDDIFKNKQTIENISLIEKETKNNNILKRIIIFIKNIFSK